MKATILALGIIANGFLVWNKGRNTDVSLKHVYVRRDIQTNIRLAFNGSTYVHEEEDQCAPLKHPIQDQCSVVKASCPSSMTTLGITYFEKYFCASATARPLIFGLLVAWLAFLFSFIGVAASDFFIPNLATIADVFGLDDNVAGVTFLAFGNGSPDLFSTLSAMRAGAGSLAIGELVGAATFIVSVVAGTMCLVNPFHVNRIHFLRDVGFFTVSVTLLFVILHDGVLHAWEAISLACLYLCYVVVVILSTWWEKRRDRKLRSMSTARAAYEHETLPEISIYIDDEPYLDNPEEARSSSPLLEIPSSPRQRSHSMPVRPPSHLLSPTREDTTVYDQIETNPDRPRALDRSTSYFTHRPTHAHSQLPSFSLLGALEFRSVVTSLRRESTASVLSAFDTPVSPTYAGGHYHFRSRSSSRRSSRDYTHDVELERSRNSSPGRSTPSPLLTPDINLQLPLHAQDKQLDNQNHVIVPASEAPSSLTASVSQTYPSKQASQPKRVISRLGKILHVLFPTLHDFTSKSVVSMIASVLAAPAVVLLTITLPVVISHRHSGSMRTADSGHIREGHLVDLDDNLSIDGVSVLSEVERMVDDAEEDIQDELHGLAFNRWLTAAQLVLGPIFCVAVCFGTSPYAIWLFISTTIVGLSAAALVAVFADEGKDPAARIALCLMGFTVSMVWIMAIADEVVQVLNTFGLIFGLSDAIIGLTIFAIGNSLADFVANFTVASFAPIMGYSACFGGPMLNILLGIGLSGSLVISQTGKPYTLDFSKTLLVSSLGLLVLLTSTLVYVPLNGFFLDRRWGGFLIFLYVLIMTANILVEIYY